ncbi:hypothetical protein [Rhodococcus sp. ACT016]|uniref:hypothetical protein n=1 Tax=Rhodococcus sp. ACT016 TaxID=3134808 RepID=UPI003D2DAA13
MRLRVPLTVAALLLTAGCSNAIDGHAIGIDPATTTAATTTTTPATPSPAAPEPEPEPVIETTTPPPAHTTEQTTEETYEPPSVSAVTVGQPCSSPSAVGTDVNTGKDIVCVYTGGGGNVWVNSIPIVGVNNVGDPCDSSATASQTPAGKAIMCVNGQWTYGP